ncbi:MAG: acyl-CoA dehydrogenase, partial [Halioglobus sp.]|nr:acyl-CoA dehydrogenase [Halioglobus sp.]
CADRFIVAARTAPAGEASDGISLFLVDAAAPGVSAQRRIMVDSRNMAEVSFDDVRVEAGALLGPLHGGGALLERVVDRGNIALAAEMLGCALEAFERTLDYLRTRQQFGAYIGTFQALQHRAAQMFCELEMSRSVVRDALRAVDDDDDNVALCASRAKVQVSETLRLVTDESIQMHGGIGMTDEEEIGFFLKRARVAQQTLGDEHYHLDRCARLMGY